MQLFLQRMLSDLILDFETSANTPPIPPSSSFFPLGNNFELEFIIFRIFLKDLQISVIVFLQPVVCKSPYFKQI